MYRVAVMTGTRAEYGLLRGVLAKMQAGGVLQPQLLVTGSHLSPAHGMTVQEIEADGFAIALRLDILSAPVGQGRVATARRTAAALQGFLAWLCEHRPDALLLLGDRYEALAAGQAAALLDIPLVHISGGDVTAGADDDWFRHCLSKMAKLHFPSCERYRQRLLRMGEAPDRVFNVGGLGDENIRRMQLLGREALAQALDIPSQGPLALITLHPQTQGAVPPRQQAQALLAALEAFPQLFYLFTGANADAGGEEINAEVTAFCQGRANAVLVPSLGVLRYLSAMRWAAVVVGNSSSGVVETASLGVPAVDIGERQQGRERPANVVHCAMRAPDIKAALQQALDPAFARRAKQVQSPYHGGDTSGHICRILQEMLASGALRAPKRFYDGPGEG